MSNRSHRRPPKVTRRSDGGVILTPEQLFPGRVTVTSLERANMARFAKLFAEKLRRDPHLCYLEEIGDRIYEVFCSCGFTAPAPFGEQQGLRIRERHLALFHVIPDPTGAIYAN